MASVIGGDRGLGSVLKKSISVCAQSMVRS